MPLPSGCPPANACASRSPILDLLSSIFYPPSSILHPRSSILYRPPTPPKPVKSTPQRGWHFIQTAQPTSKFWVALGSDEQLAAWVAEREQREATVRSRAPQTLSPNVFAGWFAIFILFAGLCTIQASKATRVSPDDISQTERERLRRLPSFGSQTLVEKDQVINEAVKLDRRVKELQRVRGY